MTLGVTLRVTPHAYVGRCSHPFGTRFWSLRAQRWLDQLSAERISWFGAGLTVAAAGGVGYLLVVAPIMAAQATPPPPRPQPAPLRVQVIGEVGPPGSYDLPHTARVEDAVHHSGRADRARGHGVRQPRGAGGGWPTRRGQSAACTRRRRARGGHPAPDVDAHATDTAADGNAHPMNHLLAPCC